MIEVDGAVLEQLRTICLALPDAYEEPAWTGVRWRVRSRTFAHVLVVGEGASSAYGAVGSATVVTFRADAEELAMFREAGPPYFFAGWGRDVVGLLIDAHTDWTEVAELLTDSFCVLAPRTLVARVERPVDPAD